MGRCAAVQNSNMSAHARSATPLPTSTCNRREKNNYIRYIRCIIQQHTMAPRETLRSTVYDRTHVTAHCTGSLRVARFYVLDLPARDSQSVRPQLSNTTKQRTQHVQGVHASPSFERRRPSCPSPSVRQSRQMTKGTASSTSQSR